MKKLTFSKYIIFLIILSFCGFSDSNVSPEVETTSTSTTLNPSQVEIDSDLIDLVGCKPFKGYYQNKIDCITGTTFETLIKFETQVNNIVEFENTFYFVLNNGKIFQHERGTSKIELFFDFTDRIDLSNEMGGLRGLSFHPKGDYILISYVKATDMYALYVEKIQLDNEQNVITSNIIYKVDDKLTQRNHFGGHIIWSNYYQGFLLGVGDFFESSAESRLNPDPLDTTQPYGKILLLESDTIISTPLIAREKDSVKLNNIVAMGLRNSWQFFEYKNYLIIADVGLSINEELNISKVSDKTLNFGWPVYEGLDKSKDIDNIKNYELEITYWQDSNKNNIDVYFKDNYEKPVFQYVHNPNEEIYRAAIIGGDIFENLNSNYSQQIFVAEYLTGELFSIDLTTRNLSIFEIENLNKNITSLRIYDEDRDKLLISTQSGEILVLSLP